MSEVLLEAFRHHAWATKQLLDSCGGLTSEQLTSPGTATGTERGILALFNHLIQADRGYVSRRGDRPAWVDEEQESDDLPELRRRAEENAEVWEWFLAQPLEPSAIVILDHGAYEAEQSVLVVQALHHGSAHREQISAIMTGLGVQPPDVQAWSYAEATGHAGPRPKD